MKQALGRGNKSAIIEQIIFNDQILNEKQDTAEACSQYFASVGNKLADQIQPSQDNPIQHIPVGKERFQFKQINPAKVNAVLGKLKSRKATGIHNIPNKSLKLSTDRAPSLMTIFNACINERTFIDDFKTGKVSPIFKSGRKVLPGNYRPITVLFTIAHVFERIIYQQIYSFLTTNNFLSRKTMGLTFLALHSFLALSGCTNEWFLNIDQGGIKGSQKQKSKFFLIVS